MTLRNARCNDKASEFTCYEIFGAFAMLLSPNVRFVNTLHTHNNHFDETMYNISAYLSNRCTFATEIS
jgi:hypothetical protein